MELELGGCFFGYEKAILDNETYKPIAIMGDDNVPRLAIGMEIDLNEELYEHLHYPHGKEFPKQRYCINAFCLPHEPSYNYRLVCICSMEMFEVFKGNNKKGARIVPGDIVAIKKNEKTIPI